MTSTRWPAAMAATRGTAPARRRVLADNVGPVTIDVPRDRDSSFTPVIVKKRQRRLGDVDTVVLSLYAKGLTTGEISAHFAEVYGASLSKDRISVITDRVVEEMQAWCARPLLPGRDVLGLWAGTSGHGESAKFG